MSAIYYLLAHIYLFLNMLFAVPLLICKCLLNVDLGNFLKIRVVPSEKVPPPRTRHPPYCIYIYTNSPEKVQISIETTLGLYFNVFLR